MNPHNRPGGRYRRDLPVPLERLYEHVADWELLPHVHDRRVRRVVCEDWAAWGWRGTVTWRSGSDSEVEVVLDRQRGGWEARVLAGAAAGTEVTTSVVPAGADHVTLTAVFRLPQDQPGDVERAARALARWHDGFYDTAVAVMRQRQAQLDRRVDRAREAERELDLGPRRQLQVPLAFELGGREFVLVELASELVAFPRRCPHQLGPLSADALNGAVVTCPWHGYRFDVRTGENLSGRVCRLSHLPRVDVGADARVRVTATH
ncbi:MAG: Rieske (2Fe-2S) protein [Pseudomonadota bacterium]